ncbi:DUF6798 domain-containing protein [Pseudotenacibaculum haliotis]|uniref:DUF6798 domain-containing protein n=1 Tax=Pseudotenacibaculum haliotis TaxID=1862138 RepID=A0ABW5LSI5_9FLAO
MSSNSGFSLRYYYAGLIAFFAQFASIPFLFFIGTLLCNITTAIIAFLCGNTLFNNQRSGLLAATFIMTLPTVAMGSDLVLYSSLFTPTTLVFPLVLLSFYFFLQKKILYSILITGIVSVFHVLIGFEFGVLFLSISLLIDIIQKKNWGFIARKSGLFFLIFLFLLPNLIPYFQNNHTIEKSEFINILAHYRHPHHYILSEILTLKEFLKFIGFSVVFFIVYSRWFQRSSNSYHKISTLILFAFLAVSIVLNWIFIELLPSKLFTSLQLLRLLNIAKFIFLLLTADYLIKSIEQKMYDLRFFLSGLIIVLLIIFSGISILKVFVSLSLFVLLMVFTIRSYRVLATSVFVTIVTTIIIANNINHVKLTKYQKSYFSTSSNSIQSDLTEFILKNTMQQSVLLVPHDFGFIRTEAQRAIVVDFKAFPFQDKAMLEWYKRIKDCYGLNKQNFEQYYKTLNDEKIIALKNLYAFDYAILHQETVSKFPVIFSNSEYKIIDLTSYDQ